METTLAAYTQARDQDDFTTPHSCHAAYICNAAGAELDQIDQFTQELTTIVDKMKEDLMAETRILEGTEVPEYRPLDQNELSDSEHKEEQWKTDLLNGSWKIDHIPTFDADSSSSFCSADTLNPTAPIRLSNDGYIPWRRSCYPEISDVSGCAIDATNECSECTVPMISEQTPGTPNEVK